MNFVQQLEECLRDLAAEARRKHPGVKEASERATLKLRSLQHAYVSAVRQASVAAVTATTVTTSAGQTNNPQPMAHPTTSLFQSSDLLHPFLLAANYPTASPRLLDISFRAMRLLMEADAVLPTDALHMIRVWTIQAQVVAAYYQKLYARELYQQQQQQQQLQQEGDDENYFDGSYHDDEEDGGNQGDDSSNHRDDPVPLPAAATTSISSSWFRWTTSSISSVAAVATLSSSDTTSLPSSAAAGNMLASSSGGNAMSVVRKNTAVSSSSGQTGQATQSPIVVERLALEILSALLQLLELLRRYASASAPSSSSSSSISGAPTNPTPHAFFWSADGWTSAVSLACLLLPAVPVKHTVQQAARSTVSQVISLLYQTALCIVQQARATGSAGGGTVTTSGSSSADKATSTVAAATKFMTATWDDLLTLASSGASSASSASSGFAAYKPLVLNGAFRLCKRTTIYNGMRSRGGGGGTLSSFAPSSTSRAGSGATSIGAAAAAPPSPELALELLTQIMKEHAVSVVTTSPLLVRDDAQPPQATRFVSVLQNDHALLLKTLSVTVRLLQLIPQPKVSVEKALRCCQWSLVLFQTVAAQYPTEGRELMLPLIKLIIPYATEACRKHHDFEDGYVYTREERILIWGIDSERNDGPAGSQIAPVEDSILLASSSTTTINSSSNVNSSNSNMTTSADQSKRRKAAAAAATVAAAAAATSSTASAASMSASHMLLTSLFPSNLLWKAGLALETLHAILDRDTPQRAILFQDEKTVAMLAEAISDFATIGASCRDHMLQVVDFGRRCAAGGSTSSKPALIRKAEQAVLSGQASAFFTSSDEGYSLLTFDKASNKASGGSAAGAPLASVSTSILGESLWIAFQNMLRIADCLQHVDNPKSYLEETFAPLLAMLQHYLKRFVASDALVQSALTGYRILADVCLPLHHECSMQRKALQTSLCKLSLPSWGKHDAGCQLQDHHVRSLLCLLRVIHDHHDAIAAEWDLILWTMEELSVLSIASPYLNDDGYHAALAVAAVYRRFAPFSTCFSNDSLLHMTEALADIAKSSLENRDVVGDSDTVLPNRTNYDVHSGKAPSEAVGQGSISEKIMSIGVRAIYGGGGGGSGDEGDRSDVTLRQTERIKCAYYEEYRHEFVQRITSSKSAVRVNSIERIPFVLALLIDVALANVFRSKDCGETIFTHMSMLAASAPAIRPFVTDIMTMLIMSRLTEERKLPAPSEGLGRIVFKSPMQSQLLAVEPDLGDHQLGASHEKLVSQVEILAPLCKSIRISVKADVAESMLGVLHLILEGAGHHLNGDVWFSVIDSIASLSGDPSYSADRTVAAWSSCSLQGFKCLKLIVDDFLHQLPSATHSIEGAKTSLLDCCYSYVSSRHDVNTALTAIGLLWTIADQDSGIDSFESAISKLVLLASETRAEVRNAAVNTLFSCIVGRGANFSESQWASCVNDAIFRVHEVVAAKAHSGEESDNGVSGKQSSRYKVAFHHSRDSANKQWIATQVLVLRGLTRVLRNFFPKLLDTMDTEPTSLKLDDDEVPWFQDAWVKILDVSYEAAAQDGGIDTLDLRSVGVELLVVCSQLASKAGIQAAVTPARVGTNMEVVNGALRSVRESHQSAKTSVPRTHSMATEAARESLFFEAFESLEAFDEVFQNKFADKDHKLDDSDLQLLQKFSSHLSKLYDCCKTCEFAVDDGERSLKQLLGAVDEKEHDLETRFVSIVASVLNAAAVNPDARFLNQAQRTSLDLLKSMACDGSSSSFLCLVVAGGDAFFFRREKVLDDSEHDVDTGDHPSLTLVHHDAAVSVADAISKPNVSKECRVLILYKIISQFLSDRSLTEEKRKKHLRAKPYYKYMVPVIVNGMEGMSALEGQGESADHCVRLVWKDVCRCLALMLSPVPIGKDMTRIPRVSEVVEMVSSAVKISSIGTRDGLAGLLSEGANNAFEVAIEHAKYAMTHPDTGTGEKSKKQRDDLLMLFELCFSACCSLDPDQLLLRGLSQKAFRAALSADDPAVHEFSKEIAIIVCQAMKKNDRMESVVLSVFGTLCKLITSSDVKMRSAATDVFASVDISRTLLAAQERYEVAERRADQAEKEAARLKKIISQLNKQSDSLRREVAVLEASSAIL